MKKEVNHRFHGTSDLSIYEKIIKYMEHTERISLQTFGG